MGRYTKIKSKYILSNRAQSIEQGTLLERDWTTIGNVHRLEPGKRPYYGDSNFIFTENTIPTYKKKRKTGTWVGNYTYDDVKDATELVNQIKVNTNSDNLTDYAYWGSMTELFRGSVENIISTFPGRLKSTTDKLYIHHHLPVRCYFEISDTSGLNSDTTYFVSYTVDSKEVFKEFVYYMKDSNGVFFFYNDDLDGMPQTGTLISTSDDSVQYDYTSYTLYNPIDEWTEASGYVLNNPFEIDMHTELNQVPEDDLYRFVAHSWASYVLEANDVSSRTSVFPITYYEINKEPIQYDCEGRFRKLCWIMIYCGEYTLIVDAYLADGKIIYCYRENNETVEFLITYYSGLTDNQSRNNAVERIEHVVSNGEGTILPSDFSIRPNDDIINDYFDGLEAFEKKLLNRTTYPLYQNVFLLPIQTKDGKWHLTRRKYTWPSSDYCIDIESSSYDMFINEMIALCDVYDNIWCDSIWRCMVHESVKNFDWSYRQAYEDNDSDDNIEGGNRMKDVLRLYGIIYDKAKRFADGIGISNKVTYDGYNNCTEAQISDRNQLLGWDITSTRHQFYWYEPIDATMVDENVVSLPAVPINVDQTSDDYIAVTCEGVYGSDYYKKETAEVTDISIDDAFLQGSLISKQNNPWIATTSYMKIYIEVNYSSIPSDYDFSGCTFSDLPYMLFLREENFVYINYSNEMAYSQESPVLIYYGTNDNQGGNVSNDELSYPEYIKVVSDGEPTYYMLLENEQIEANNEHYVNGTWFTTRNNNMVTTDVTDVLFNRMLNLSANRILKTKGTKESIEMVFALFGFGKYDEETNPYGDFKIEERYNVYDAKGYDDTFYFYEEISEEEIPSSETPVSHDTIPTDPTEDSDTYIVVDGTYYHLNGDYTVSEAIKELYAHRLIEHENETEYSGIPINDVYYGTQHLVIPFLENGKQYDGDIYFESKGGWMKNTDKTVNSWEYSETIPYLHILQRIDDLFRLNTNDLNNSDIYFVADVSDYYKYSDSTPYYLSNYFKLLDKYNPGQFSSWVNIPIEGPIAFGSSGIDGVTKEDYEHVKHVDSIIPTVLFNNPHCGYDKYDAGGEFRQYMEYPFTYGAENYLYDDDYYTNMASQFHFHLNETVTGNKCIINADTYPSLNGNDTNETDTYAYNINEKILKITLCSNGDDLDVYDVSNRYHLEYMRNVVMKYVAQVVPSTTILVLENFVPMQTNATDYGTVDVVVEENGWGAVYGAGTYLKSTMVTLKAVANEGYHFEYWRWNGGNRANINTSTNEELTVMVCGDKTYTAVFAENCGITYGCQIREGGGGNL